MQKLILASGSRYRQSQLQGWGLSFESLSPDIDESPLPNESPAQVATRLALYKAKHVAQRYPDSWIIGCDQTGDLAGGLLGKPKNHPAALAQLRAMSGQTVLFHSAVALVCPTGEWQQVVTTKVVLRDLSDQDIKNYLQRDQPFDCAGSFKIECAGTLLMSAVSSDDPSALVGLPLIALAEMLRKSGLDPLQ